VFLDFEEQDFIRSVGFSYFKFLIAVAVKLIEIIGYFAIELVVLDFAIVRERYYNRG
jgi:hypothetical protein